MSGMFSVFFDGSNWVGVVIEDNGKFIKAGRYIFGPEPTPTEIFEWAKRGCPGLSLTEISNTQKISESIETKRNPKRIQREARRALENRPLGSYAQDKLKEALENQKKSATLKNKERRTLEAEIRYEKKILKKKKKRKGH